MANERNVATQIEGNKAAQNRGTGNASLALPSLSKHKAYFAQRRKRTLLMQDTQLVFSSLLSHTMSRLLRARSCNICEAKARSNFRKNFSFANYHEL